MDAVPLNQESHWFPRSRPKITDAGHLFLFLGARTTMDPEMYARLLTKQGPLFGWHRRESKRRVPSFEKQLGSFGTHELGGGLWSHFLRQDVLFSKIMQQRPATGICIGHWFTPTRHPKQSCPVELAVTGFLPCSKEDSALPFPGIGLGYRGQL